MLSHRLNPSSLKDLARRHYEAYDDSHLNMKQRFVLVAKNNLKTLFERRTYPDQAPPQWYYASHQESRVARAVYDFCMLCAIVSQKPTLSPSALDYLEAAYNIDEGANQIARHLGLRNSTRLVDGIAFRLFDDRIDWFNLVGQVTANLDDAAMALIMALYACTTEHKNSAATQPPPWEGEKMKDLDAPRHEPSIQSAINGAKQLFNDIDDKRFTNLVRFLSAFSFAPEVINALRHRQGQFFQLCEFMGDRILKVTAELYAFSRTTDINRHEDLVKFFGTNDFLALLVPFLHRILKFGDLIPEFSYEKIRKAPHRYRKMLGDMWEAFMGLLWLLLPNGAIFVETIMFEVYGIAYPMMVKDDVHPFSESSALGYGFPSSSDWDRIKRSAKRKTSSTNDLRSRKKGFHGE